MSDDHKKDFKLEWKGFSETKFSSLADQLFKSSDFHEKVRERIVKQLKSSPKSYKVLIEMDSSKKRSKDVPKDFSEYVNNMSKKGVWGDEVTLQRSISTPST
ncbi:unnamed protein product [Arabis nemorensis]|uniref:Uncharacterized protein n=1 Tax=Arabis nemorensis TaxID=586526 RepID=A0A565CKI2_9BRAS|nr:unnamed protein product [Arabis nemorensis]